MILCGPRTHAEPLRRTDAAEDPMNALPCETPPVRTHRDLQRRHGEDRGRPLNGVNLREEGGIHQTSAVEEFLVGPGGVLGTQTIADRIVLEGKERVHQVEPEPPVARYTGPLDPCRWVER